MPSSVAAFHLAMSPDGYLYVTNGERGAFREAAQGLKEGGADGIVVETMSETAEAVAAGWAEGAWLLAGPPGGSRLTVYDAKEWWKRGGRFTVTSLSPSQRDRLEDLL